jgi:DNA-directed RNA polymerase specialized sigma24 family protein
VEAVAGPDQDTAWREELYRRILEVALARTRPHFEERTWRAFTGVWREGRPAAEVAQELGQTIDEVYVAKSRVLKRLRQEVSELAEDTDLFG